MDLNEAKNMNRGSDWPKVPEHELIRCVGFGSYGQVWLARTVLGQWRAVKVVYRDRFAENRPYEREYMGMMRFEPLSREDGGFVDILQTGRGQGGGYFYYVMELADAVGEWNGDGAAYEPKTLARVLLDRGRLPLETVLELGISLGRALGRLHGTGLIHRDIKPSNVIYVDGRPRLADIGLVVEQSEARSWVGTEGYIPPEGPNSPRSDIYGFGKVLYVAMTGLDRSEYPALPVGFGAGEDGRRLLELNAVVLRACAASVEARYGTVGEMLLDLELVASGGSVGRVRRSLGVRFWMGMMLLGAVLLGVWVGGGELGIGGRGGFRGRESGLVTTNAGVGLTTEVLTARGARHLDEQDEFAALVHFVSALSAAEARGEPTEVQRVRIGAVRDAIPRLAMMMDSGGEVFSLDFSPDGRLVATGDDRGAVTVWDVATGRRVHGPHAPSGFPVKVRFGAGSRRLLLVPAVHRPAVQGVDRPIGSARILDTDTGLPLAPEVGGVSWGVFSPSGEWLAMIGKGDRLELHRIGDGEVGRVLEDGSAPVSWIEFSPDGEVLGSVSSDEVARLWRVRDGSMVGEPRAIFGRGMRLDFSATGDRVATLAVDAGRRWTMGIWEVSGNPKPPELAHFTNLVPVLEYGRLGGRGILMGDGGGGMTVTGVGGAMSRSMELRAGKGVCRQWAFNRDGDRVAVGSEDGVVRVWSVPDSRPLTPLLRHEQAVDHVALTPDGSRLLTATQGGVIRIWELRGSGLELEPVEIEGSLMQKESSYAPYPAALVREGRHLIMGMERGGIRVPVLVDPQNGREVPLPLERGDPECGVLVADKRGSRVAVYRPGGGRPAANNDVLLLRWHAGRWERQLLPHRERVMEAAFLDDAPFLMTLDMRGELRVWELETGRLVREERLFDGGLAEGGLSLDGRSVCWLDAGARILQVRELDPLQTTGRVVVLPATMVGRMYHRRPYLLSLATAGWRMGQLGDSAAENAPFPAANLDGMRIMDAHLVSGRLVASSEIGENMILDLRRQTEVGIMGAAGSSPARSLAFDPHGRFLILVDRDGGVALLDAVTGEPVLPRVSHVNGVEVATLTSDGLLVALGHSGRLLRWRVRLAMESSEELRDWAELVAARRLDGAGRLRWINSSSLASRFRN
jgi:WD40 repeat protein